MLQLIDDKLFHRSQNQCILKTTLRWAGELVDVGVSAQRWEGERGRGKGAGGDLALTRFVKLEPKESERGIRNL